MGLLVLFAVLAAAVALPSDGLTVNETAIRVGGNTTVFNITVTIGSPHEYTISSYTRAVYMAVHFLDFDLGLGDVVTVSSTNKLPNTEYNYTLKGPNQNSKFYARFVPGRAARISYHPSNWSVPSKKTAFRIDGYAWGLQK